MSRLLFASSPVCSPKDKFAYIEGITVKSDNKEKVNEWAQNIATNVMKPCDSTDLTSKINSLYENFGGKQFIDVNESECDSAVKSQLKDSVIYKYTKTCIDPITGIDVFLQINKESGTKRVVLYFPRNMAISFNIIGGILEVIDKIKKEGTITKIVTKIVTTTFNTDQVKINSHGELI